MKQKTLDYIPHSKGDQRGWFLNFKTQLGTLGISLGYTAAQVTSIQSNLQKTIDAIDGVVAAEDNYNAAVQTQKTTVASSIALIRTEAAKLKANPAIPIGALDSLGLTASHHVVDEDNYTPNLSVSLIGGLPTLKFTKNGVDGVKILHRLKGTTVWSVLAVVTKSPYIDHIILANPAISETWEYCAYGIIADQPIGKQSNVVHVVYAG